MALKYEDYRAKYVEGKDEELDAELESAQEVAEEREANTPENSFVIPDRFKGKSAEDIAKAYAELEKLNSRQAQELGEARKMQDALITKLTSDSPNPQQEAPSEPVTSDNIDFDSLLEDTAGTIQRALDSTPEMQELKRVAARSRQQEFRDALTAVHPDADQIISDPAFQNWALEDPSLKEALVRADQGDLHTADLLLRAFKNTKEVNKAQATAKREATLTKAATESSSANEPPPPQTYSRSEFFEQILAAKRGDDKARRYLQVHYPKYRKALASGNVRD